MFFWKASVTHRHPTPPVRESSKDHIMTWHLPGLAGRQNSTLRPIWGGKMTPCDPTGWRGLGSVSLHSFLPVLPPVHSAKRLLGAEALWASDPLRCTLRLEAAWEPWLSPDTRPFPANGSPPSKAVPHPETPCRQFRLARPQSEAAWPLWETRDEGEDASQGPKREFPEAEVRTHPEG